MADFFGLSSGSGNTTNDSFGFSLADYASIKNGSYRKLLASNYANEEKAAAEAKKTDTKQSLTAISDTASGLKNSIDAVQKLFETKKDENGFKHVSYDEDKMYKAIKDFIDNYNSTIDEASKSDNKTLLRAAKNMVSFTEANKNALDDIGITVGSDNKLSIDKDKFKDASKGSVQSIFQSSGGYAEQISAKASSLALRSANAAKKVDESSSKSSSSSALKSIATSTDSAKTLGKIQDAAEDAKKSLTTLLESGSKSKFNKVTKQDENGKYYMDYDKDSIYKAVKDFVKDYNTLLDESENTSTSSIEQARKTLVNYAEANKSALSKVGITIGSDGSLSVNETSFKNADMEKVKDLFQKSGSFGKMAWQQIEKMGTYAEREASKSNTYSNNGTYTNNFNSGDWFTSSI